MPTDAHLEPRVARLETGFEILTREVSTLAGVIRDHSRNVEGELNKLTVAVTQANSPKKTEWHTLIALAGLIMVIGSAVFFPLYQKIESNKEDTRALVTSLRAHELQSGHPVAMTEIKQLQSELNKVESNIDERNKEELGEYRALKLRMMEEALKK